MRARSDHQNRIFVFIFLLISIIPYHLFRISFPIPLSFVLVGPVSTRLEARGFGGFANFEAIADVDAMTEVLNVDRCLSEVAFGS